MIIAPITLLSLSSATVWDLKTNKIPNAITLTSVLIGILVNSYLGGLVGLGHSLAGTFVGIFLLIIPFALGGIGAGDVKLLAAVGALNGAQFVLFTFLYGAIAGGLIALGIVIVRGQLYSILLNIAWTLRNFSVNIFKAGAQRQPSPSSGIRFPYGIAILIGTLATYLMG